MKLTSGQGVIFDLDGKGRVFDNIFAERLWRTVKVEMGVRSIIASSEMAAKKGLLYRS